MLAQPQGVEVLVVEVRKPQAQQVSVIELYEILGKVAFVPAFLVQIVEMLA